jgi:hypothetical protein
MKKNTKKELIKLYVERRDFKVYSVNDLHFELTGGDGAAIWHEPILNVSKSTVRRALEDLVLDGKMKSYMLFGHCYDETLYEKT